MLFKIAIISSLFNLSLCFSMEADVHEENSTPHHGTRCLKLEKMKVFQSWFLENAQIMHLKKYNGTRVTPHTFQLFEQNTQAINRMFTTFNDKNALKQLNKLFGERVLKSNVEGFLSFVVSFHGVWKDLVDDYALTAPPEALGKEIHYFFQDCSPELKSHFKAFQRLSTIFLTGYGRFFNKTLKPADAFPELSLGQIYIGYFSDENGYLPLPLDRDSQWDFQPLLYGEKTTIPGVGHKGFITNGAEGIIRCSGIRISLNKMEKCNISYHRGENDPLPFYSENTEISVRSGMVSGRNRVEKETVSLLERFIDKLEKVNNGDSYDSFVPLVHASQDTRLNNYIFLTDLTEDMRNEPENIALLGAAAWVLKQEGQEPVQSKEELIDKIEQLQRDLEQNLLSTYEAEILAEQQEIRQRHIQEDYQRGAKKKAKGQKRRPQAKVRRNCAKGAPAPDPTNEEIKKIKDKAQEYLRNNVQKARVTYRQLSKLTNNMIKDVFSEHKDIFKKNTVGSHINIHIEGSQGLTLVKKHKGGHKDLTIAGSQANDYMSRLVNKGIKALRSPKARSLKGEKEFF